VFARLNASYDYSSWHWQPGTSADYVCITSVLVQHTAWANVGRAIERMQRAGVFSLEAVERLTEEHLTGLVRPAGTPRTKARRLQALARLASDSGGLGQLLLLPTTELRARLLETSGIGPETADAILLYAAARPLFQVDAYAIRLCRRLGIGPDGLRYDAWQRWFESSLQADAAAYQRWHGLIVLHGKETCRTRPRCSSCCIVDLCPTGRVSSVIM
jgi:endonuclease-3 related protein